MGVNSSRITQPNPESSITLTYRRQLEDVYEDLCHDGILHKEKFLEHFSGPCDFIAEMLFKEMTEVVLRGSNHEKNVISRHHHRNHLMSKEGFITRASQVIERAYQSKRAQLFYYYKLIAGNKHELSQKDVIEILAFCCTFGFLVGSYDTKYMHNLEDDEVVVAHANSMLGENESISQQNFLSWAEEHNPNLFAAFQSWIHAKLTKNLPKSHFHMIPYTDPAETKSNSRILSASMLWYLCCTLPACYTEPDKRFESLHEEEDDHGISDIYVWHLLYDSDQHGLSLNRFKHKCMDYKSPNVTLLRLRSGCVIALALDCGWQDSSEKFGGPYASMHEIVPNPSTVIAMANTFYLKSTGRNVHTGLQIGNTEPAKLLLDKDFSKADVLYKGGELDDVSSIEVWGCGGVKASQSQQKQKAWEKKEIEKRSKVKCPGRWDENPDRSILEMGGVNVSHSERSDV